MQDITITKANNLTITTSNDLQQSTLYLHELKATLTKIEDEEAKVTDPLKEALKQEQARFAPFKTQLKEAIQNIRTQQSNYQTYLLNEQKKAQEALQAGKIDLSQAITAHELPTIQGLTFRTTYRVKIINIRLIPKSYMIPNEAKILEDLKANIKVKGATLEEIQTPVNRK